MINQVQEWNKSVDNVITIVHCRYERGRHSQNSFWIIISHFCQVLRKDLYPDNFFLPSLVLFYSFRLKALPSQILRTLNNFMRIIWLLLCLVIVLLYYYYRYSLVMIFIVIITATVSSTTHLCRNIFPDHTFQKKSQRIGLKTWNWLINSLMPIYSRCAFHEHDWNMFFRYNRQESSFKTKRNKKKQINH